MAARADIVPRDLHPDAAGFAAELLGEFDLRLEKVR